MHCSTQLSDLNYLSLNLAHKHINLSINTNVDRYVDMHCSAYLSTAAGYESIDEKLSPNIRAIQFNLFESLGTLSIEKFKGFIKDISLEEKNALSKLGIRIGAKYFLSLIFLKKPLWNY